MAFRFGLITEGITDQTVIEAILIGIIGKESDVIINCLQPLRDETDRNKMKSSGGWSNLLDYCNNKREIEEALAFCNFIIIQIDTDRCHEYGVSVNGNETIPILVEKVKGKICERLGEDFINMFGNRVIFAVTVHEIECWLLPLYSSRSVDNNQIVGCIARLNKAIKDSKGYYLDKKNVDFYRDLSDPFCDTKVLNGVVSKNESLNLFVQSIKGVLQV